MKGHNIINGKREFILLTSTWYIQYQWIEQDGLFKYGLNLKYKETGTDFKCIHANSKAFASNLEMKKAIKEEIHDWLLKKQIEHNISELPFTSLHEFINPQLNLF